MELSETYEALRLLLNDTDSSVRRYPDAVLAGGVRTMLALQLVPGLAPTPDRRGFTPEPDPNQFALVLLHTARLFLIPQPENYSFRTRALSESFGGQTRDWLYELSKDIHRLENGTMFAGWQDFCFWFESGGCLPSGYEPWPGYVYRQLP